MALFARENELESVCALLAPPRIGGALVLRGKAGVGKSALLNEVISAGKRAGVRILSTAGVSSQMQQPFAGLSHLMRSVLTDPTLPDGYADARDTVRAAIGGQDVPIGNPFSVAYAVLELTAGPILLARPGNGVYPGRLPEDHHRTDHLGRAFLRRDGPPLPDVSRTRAPLLIYGDFADPLGHIQATGVDGRRRTQCRHQQL